MTGFLRRIALSMSTGMVFVVFSELLFWGMYDFRHKLVAQFLPTWFVYSLMAYVFLWSVSYFGAKSVWAVFLCGAIFGWLDEGVVVQTMYEQLPSSLSITGLSWHALLTVLAGWYLFRRTIASARPTAMLRLSAIAGVLWALWSVWWWINTKTITPPGEFLIYSLITTGLLALGLAGCRSFAMREFSPSRGESIAIGLIVALYYLGVTVRADIRALVVLPPLIALTLWALLRNKRAVGPGSAIGLPADGKTALCYLSVAAMPLAASMLYWSLHTVGARLHTGPVIYIVTALAGFAMYAASIRAIIAQGRMRT